MFMEQLLCHILGDYILQSDWMAMNKGKKTVPCLVHCFIYTLPFLILTQEWKALLIIFISHFIFDRWHILLKRVIWIKNHLNPRFEFPDYEWCNTTGYYDDSPYNTYPEKLIDGWKYMRPKGWETPRHFFITIWLYIITDNFFQAIQW